MITVPTPVRTRLHAVTFLVLTVQQALFTETGFVNNVPLAPTIFRPTSYCRRVKSIFPPHIVVQTLVMSDYRERSEMLQEGDVRFDPGGCFYRPHSKVVRDLGVLSLLVHRKRIHNKHDSSSEAADIYSAHTNIRVLDAMCGTGVRALRYLQEGGADFVHANDANDDGRLAAARERNLQDFVQDGRVQLSLGDAMDLYFGARLERRYFDMIDVDGFGTGAPHSAEATWALRRGGLLYLCATDSRTAAGKNGAVTGLRGYGGVVGQTPLCNELGIRLVVADAARQAAVRGMRLEPVWGFFHRQSSCVRVMMRLVEVGKGARGEGRLGEIGWVAYCRLTGNHWCVGMEEVQNARGAAGCPREAKWEALEAAGLEAGEAAEALEVVGPVWVGELQDATELTAMAREAEETAGMEEAKALVKAMAQEAGMPVGYIRLREVGKFLGAAGVGAVPKKAALVGALRREGFRAGEAQSEAQAVKTDAPMEEVVAAAKQLVAASAAARAT